MRPNTRIPLSVKRRDVVTPLINLRAQGEESRRVAKIDESNLKSATNSQAIQQQTIEQNDASIKAGKIRAIAMDTLAIRKLLGAAEVNPEMQAEVGSLMIRQIDRLKDIGAPTDQAERLAVLAKTDPAAAEKYMDENTIPILEAKMPELFASQKVDPSDVSDQGQVFSRDSSGKVSAIDVEGFAPKPPTSESSPAAVREYEFYSELNPEDQERYLQVKRAARPVDLGDRTVIPSLSNPSGEPVATFDEGLAPKDQPENISAAKAAESGGVNLTPAEKAVDTKFGADYAEYVAGGGSADAQKQLAQIREVGDALRSGKNLTGPVLGLVPQWIQAFTNPDSVDVREQFEEVVQRNLRLVLGAQFTEKEGERLISRAYNPQLSEEVNEARVTRLLKQMGDAAAAKERAVRYYEEHGTLKGYDGKLPSIDDFEIKEQDEADIDEILRNAGIEVD